MISVHFQGKPFNITVIQAYAPTTEAKEAEVDQFYKDPLELLELMPKKKKNPFHCRRMKYKSKSRDPGVTGKFGLGVQNEVGQRLTKFCQEKLRSLQGNWRYQGISYKEGHN